MRPALAITLAALALPAAAATSEVSPSGFLVSLREEVPATPQQAWDTLVQVSRWWDGQHSYSGDAANLSLEPRAGGCWCERWAGGSVEHGRVLHALPGKSLRLEGGFGPLQAMAVNAVLTFKLEPAEGKTAIVVTYRVRGSPDAGLDKLAPAVDGVMSEQVKHLADLLRK
jgi:uncharacterized protein YndB with AHSA1/START domain